MNQAEAFQTLHDALPANPDDHGPVAVPSDAIRALVDVRLSCPSCGGRGHRELEDSVEDCGMCQADGYVSATDLPEDNAE